MTPMPKSRLKNIPSLWFEFYNQTGIDIQKVNILPPYRWDKDILDFIAKYGAKYFRQEAIWGIDWSSKVTGFGYSDNSIFNDPRSKIDKIKQKLYKESQLIFNSIAYTGLKSFIKQFKR